MIEDQNNPQSDNHDNHQHDHDDNHHHHSNTMIIDNNEMIDEDWEEWDMNQCPFWIHCIAGSMAGVVEHGATYPLDTVRTHIQVCAACIHNPQNQPNSPIPSTSTSPSLLSTSSTPSPATCASASTSPHLTSTTTSASSSSSFARSTMKAATATSAANHSTTTTMTPSSTSLYQQQHKLPLGMWQTIRYLVSEPTALHIGGGGGGGGSNAIEGGPHRINFGGITSEAVAINTGASTSTTNTGSWFRLWRGVQTIFIGCIPAHALYFSSYEMIKQLCMDKNTGVLSPYGSSLAGAIATIGHDCIMTPLDTIKQRMQLGYYNTISSAIRTIIHEESIIALYRSFPITLISNIPYGMIMVTTNETCKTYLSNQYYQHTNQHHHNNHINHNQHNQRMKLYHIIISSSLAGFIASAITTPLDRIKTSLQTQQLKPMCLLLLQHNQQQQQQHNNVQHTTNANTTNANPPSQCLQPRTFGITTSAATSQQPQNIYIKNWYHAITNIYHREGLRGFVRGLTPRVLSHTPAVAISWTTYETAKVYIMKISSNTNS